MALTESRISLVLPRADRRALGAIAERDGLGISGEVRLLIRRRIEEVASEVLATNDDGPGVTGPTVRDRNAVRTNAR
jgi:hypothetical protein